MQGWKKVRPSRSFRRHLHKPHLRFKANNLSKCISPSLESKDQQSEFWKDVHNTRMALFKPDGATYGLIVFFIALSSTVWAIVFHARLRIPNYFWKWDHNVIANGISSFVPIVIYSVLFFLIWRALVIRTELISKVLAWNIYPTCFLFLIFEPIFPLIFESYLILSVLGFPFFCIVIFSAKTYVNGYLRKIKERKSLSYSTRRIIRTNLVKQARIILRQSSTRRSVGIYAISPVYFLMCLVAWYASVDAFSFGLLKQKWIVFDDVPGQVAVYRSDEYWIIKDVRRISDTLLMYPKTRIVKTDDPKYSVFRYTRDSYYLKEIDNDKISELGPFGDDLFKLGTSDKID